MQNQGGAGMQFNNITADASHERTGRYATITTTARQRCNDVGHVSYGAGGSSGMNGVGGAGVRCSAITKFQREHGGIQSSDAGFTAAAAAAEAATSPERTMAV